MHSSVLSWDSLLLTPARYFFFFKLLAALAHSIVETMDSGEREINWVIYSKINHAAMTIINLQKEYRLSWELNRNDHHKSPERIYTGLGIESQ